MKPQTTNDVRIPKTFTPIGSRIALQVIRQDTSEGGIHIPGNVKAANNPEAIQAWVVAVGPDVKQIKVGDRVIVPPQLAGEVVKFRSHSYIIVLEERVHGIAD